jgi:hypothetical protein
MWGEDWGAGDGITDGMVIGLAEAAAVPAREVAPAASAADWAERVLTKTKQQKPIANRRETRKAPARCVLGGRSDMASPLIPFGTAKTIQL